jgi:hypothetical protein
MPGSRHPAYRPCDTHPDAVKFLAPQRSNGWPLTVDFSGELMHVARLARWTGRAAAVAGCVALAGLAAPAFAQDPLGNNGTIKVDNVVFDSDPNNEPHVDCEFQVDFYGFDAGDLFADVTFELHPPTTGADNVLLTDEVFIGEDDNSGGGSEAGLDASETYTLTFPADVEPHAQQGFHVKLTINAEGSQGADVKHKVFWVQPCVTPTKTPTPTPSKSETPTPTPTPSKSVETPTPTPSKSVETPAPPVPTAVPGGADASGGGSGAGLLGLALATGGAVAGTAAIARRRFLHDS